MADAITGAIFGAFFTLGIMHLLYKKTYTFKGWVDKNNSITRYWLITTLYFIGAVSSLLYMIYS